MRRVRYPLVFIVAVVLLTVAALSAYARIGPASSSREPVAVIGPPSEPVPPAPPPSATAVADYGQFAETDAAWRKQHARHYTIAEIRALGDGTRSARQALDDRVYLLVKRGENERAISELERWIDNHPRDENAILWLARMLRESGRIDDAVSRYRQLLSIEER